MTKIILYTRRNVGLYALTYLLSRGYKVKVISDDIYVKGLATSLGVELLEDFDRMGEFDLFLSVHGNRIVPMKYLEGKGAVNVHPCIKYKGHNPIKRYIERGDTIATIDSHYMTEIVDEGEVIASTWFYTGRINTYADFYNKAVPYYFEILHSTLEKLYLKP